MLFVGKYNRFQVHPISFQSSWGLFQGLLLWLVLLSPSCFTTFFSSLARSRYLFSFALSFLLKLWSAGMVKSISWHVHFFFLVTTKLVFWHGFEWSAFISKSSRILCLIFHPICVCSCTPFSASLLPLLMWFTVLSLSQHSLHLLFPSSFSSSSSSSSN